MVTIRRFLLFSSLAILTGCGSVQCGPGLGYGTAEYCHYRVRIVEIDRQNYHVKGELVDEVFDKDSGKWTGERGKATTQMPKVLTFRVRDLEHLESQMKVGQTYNFSGPNDSTYLELYPEAIYDPTVDREERTKK
jgi:hypothetical protein